jgi:hypothetical protein
MTTYIVIESTPGYLPEDDDPFITDDYQDATAHAHQLADELHQDGWCCDRSWASADNYLAIYCTRTDSEHDLGRFIAVQRCEEEAHS